LRAQIGSLAGMAAQKETLLKARLDAANAITCNTSADARQLEGLWGEIRPLAWEVHLNAGKAEGVNNRLKGIIAKADALNARYDKADQETPVPLSAFPQKLRELTAGLKAHRDGTFTLAYNKVREKRGECDKAYDEAIASFDGIVAGAGLSSDPRVGAFKTELNANRPSKAKPCNEESSKSTLDEYIKKSEEGQASIEKWVEDIKNVPLCNGQKAETTSRHRPTRRRSSCATPPTATSPRRSGTARSRPRASPPRHPRRSPRRRSRGRHGLSSASTRGR